MTRIPTVTEPTRDELGPRELSDYEDYNRDLLRWLSRLGKNPAQRKGTHTTTHCVMLRKTIECGLMIPTRNKKVYNQIFRSLATLWLRSPILQRITLGFPKSGSRVL